MAHVLGLHKTSTRDSSILREVKCRVWWTLYMADKWCPPGLGLPREFGSLNDYSLDLPMDEVVFQELDSTAQIEVSTRTHGLWAQMIKLVEVVGPIQDLNQSLVQNSEHRTQIDRQVAHFADCLQRWENNLPEYMVMEEETLDAYRSKRFGGPFVALHLGYHHYCTLLYFQYLDASNGATAQGQIYANRCRTHALAYSRLLRCARDKGDCQVVYMTVAYLTMVSSSVLLHMLLFGNSAEVEIARVQLSSNFEALVELKSYWPHMDMITQRLLTFQNACLRSTNSKTYKVDGWMVRFLLEHALPLEQKEDSAIAEQQYNSCSPLTPHHEVPTERTDMLVEAFAGLRE